MRFRKDYFELLTFDQQAKYEAEYLRQNKTPDFQTFLEGECNSFHKFIMGGFIFDTSQEGYYYWHNLSNENKCLPDWINIYYNDISRDSNRVVIKKDCRSFRLPDSYADTIAEDLMLQNVIGDYVIVRDGVSDVYFEADINK
jgi:hypothetical protein